MNFVKFEIKKKSVVFRYTASDLKKGIKDSFPKASTRIASLETVICTLKVMVG